MQYVETVYPKADLREREFCQDLYERIKRSILKQKRNSRNSVGPENVPYYIKDSFTEQIFRQEEKEEVKPEEKADEPTGIFFDTGKLKTNFFEKRIPETTVESTEKNILLLSLSTYPYANPLWQYRVDSSEQLYPYFYQLEPVPQIVQRQLDNRRIDKIVIFFTNKVESERKPVRLESSGLVEEMSALVYFKKRYLEWAGLEAAAENELFECIRIDENSPAQGVEEAVKYLRLQKADGRGKEYKINLYIDEHGGLRGLQSISEAVISLLKNDVNIASIYTAVPDNNTHIATIVKNDAAIDIYDFVSGINEFLNYGRIESLERYYSRSGNQKLRKSDIEGMRTVADGLMLCDTRTFKDGIDHVKRWLRDTQNEEGNYLNIFKNAISEDYGKLLTEGSGILERIEWCAKKGFLQQALTYIESDMPEEFYMDNFFDLQYSSGSIKKRTDVLKCEFGKRYMNYLSLQENIFYLSLETFNNRIIEKWKTIIPPVKQAELSRFFDSLQNNGDTYNTDFELEGIQAAESFIRYHIPESIGSFNEYDALRSREYVKKIKEFAGSNGGNFYITWADLIGNTEELNDTESGEWIKISLKQGNIDHDRFERILLLHWALKKERNNSNHANSGKRIPSAFIKKMILYYMEECRALQESFKKTEKKETLLTWQVVENTGTAGPDMGLFSSIQLPNVCLSEAKGINFEKLSELAKITIYMAKSKHYENGRAEWDTLLNEAAKIGFNIPEKSELSEEKKQSGLALLLKYYPDLFQREENASNTGKPWIIISANAGEIVNNEGK